MSTTKDLKNIRKKILQHLVRGLEKLFHIFGELRFDNASGGPLFFDSLPADGIKGNQNLFSDRQLSFFCWKEGIKLWRREGRGRDSPDLETDTVSP